MILGRVYALPFIKLLAETNNKDMEELLKVSKPYIIRNKTGCGELAKTHLQIMGHNNQDVAVIISRYILSKDDVLKKYATPVREFKGYTLYQQYMGIRINTFREIHKWLCEMNVDGEFL